MMKTKNHILVSIAAVISVACALVTKIVPTAVLTPTITPVPPTGTVTPVPPTSTSTLSPTPTDIPGVFNPQNGHRYLAVYTPLSWEAARDYCRRMKAELVTITSEEENQFVFHLNSNSWIGLSDALEEGNWKWVTGEPLGYTHWAETEPNNCTDCSYVPSTEGEDYAHFNDNPPDQWNDWPAFETSSFVCEWEAVPAATPGR
jgi:hypothetical protein